LGAPAILSERDKTQNHIYIRRLGTVANLVSVALLGLQAYGTDPEDPVFFLAREVQGIPHLTALIAAL
jgi:hypothetical protein